MKNIKFIAIILILSLSILTLAGCETKKPDAVIEPIENISEEFGVTIEDNKVTFTDGRGQITTLNKNPERVVVLYNSYLEVWMQNGGHVIGKLEDSVGQAEIPGTEGAEIVGALGSISLEKLLEVKPDLIILNSGQKSQMELVATIEQNNIPLMAIDYVGKDDYLKLVRIFTALNDRDDLFQQNAVAVKEGIDSYIEKSPRDKNYKVLIMMASAKSVTARGSESYVGEMLKDLNTVNIADLSNEALNDKNFSIEKILEEDPDFIFVQTTGNDMEKVKARMKEDVESNPAWSSLSAVKGDKYIVLPKDLYMFKANQRYAEAYKGLAEILYPEVFK